MTEPAVQIRQGQQSVPFDHFDRRYTCGCGGCHATTGAYIACMLQIGVCAVVGVVLMELVAAGGTTIVLVDVDNYARCHKLVADKLSQEDILDPDQYSTLVLVLVYLLLCAVALTCLLAWPICCIITMVGLYVCNKWCVLVGVVYSAYIPVPATVLAGWNGVTLFDSIMVGLFSLEGTFIFVTSIVAAPLLIWSFTIHLAAYRYVRDVRQAGAPPLNTREYKEAERQRHSVSVAFTAAGQAQAQAPNAQAAAPTPSHIAVAPGPSAPPPPPQTEGTTTATPL